MLSAFLHLVGIGLTTLLAWGGLVLAAAAFVARADPRVPGWASSIAATALLCVAIWNFSALHHDRADDLRRLRETIAEQARQREAAEEIAARAQEAARTRANEAETLRGQIDDYERALATGDVAACPDDPDYRRRMRDIRIRAPASAGAGN
ncbi:hypothetical protein [Breoghania sp. JC706]|uniref:hypothetical protein n=1 Tax=Breoghania sp. JC706 TaxID=3117732 RepID=UPI00300B07D2